MLVFLPKRGNSKNSLRKMKNWYVHIERERGREREKERIENLSEGKLSRNCLVSIKLIVDHTG